MKHQIVATMATVDYRKSRRHVFKILIKKKCVMKEIVIFFIHPNVLVTMKAPSFPSINNPIGWI
ncbi:MAG TPA: hypothetical protein VFG46_28475 [Chryseolinea sp.]|nr:hypothetical protein [Chryseolinea sp.]